MIQQENQGENADGNSTKVAVVSLVIIFLGLFITGFLLYKTLPKLTEEEKQHIKFPWNIEDVKHLGLVFNRYKDDHYIQVVAGIFLGNVFFQFTGLPGSAFLAILSGFLFPLGVALIITCTSLSLGAALFFFFSQILYRKVFLKYFPTRTQAFIDRANKHRDNFLNYFLFLRVTNITPDWLLNLTAPIVGMPLLHFVVCTFLGVAPPKFVNIKLGQTLQELTVDDQVLSTNSIICLALCGSFALLPIVIRPWLKKKFE